mgnify:CR=1 FL=1
MYHGRCDVVTGVLPDAERLDVEFMVLQPTMHTMQNPGSAPSLT